MDNSKRTKLNWTDRKSIDQNCVEVIRHDVGIDEPAKVAVKLNLPPNEFASSAFVALEAYRNPLSKRFECGTVGNLKIPEFLDFDIFGTGVIPSLRLLIVDNDKHPGRLLGTIEKIVIPGSGNKKTKKSSLMVVDELALGSEIWNVSFPGTGPRMAVNTKVPNILHELEHNPQYYGLIIPSAFRQVLVEIAYFHQVHECADTEHDWVKDWIEFCKKLGIDEDPREKEIEDKPDWIDRCVKKFCSQHNFVDSFTSGAKGR